MKTFLKIFLLLLAVSLTVTVLVACGGDDPKPSGGGVNETEPTLEISEEGFLVINGETTEYSVTPTTDYRLSVEVAADGYYVINGEKTAFKAKNSKGEAPALEVDASGFWVLGGEVTDFKAVGECEGLFEHSYVDGICTSCEKRQPSEGLEFLLNYEGTEYSVSGVGSFEGDVLVIPDTYLGLPVTAISGYALDHTDIVEVYITQSVKTIGNGAFGACMDLKFIDLGGVETIGYNAFNSCEYLETIVFGDSIYEIGESAFAYCHSLTDIVIPDTVKTIGESAFYFCEGLDEVVIGKGVTSIGAKAFFNSGLKSIVIGENVETVGSNAFSYCTGLTSLHFPASVKVIEDYVFRNLVGLKSLTVDEANENYKSVDDCIYTKDGKTLIYYAVGNEREALVIPDGVEEVKFFSFAYAKNLKSVVIPASVATIGSFAFDYCENLTIYAEATSASAGWDKYWNEYECPVEWGFRAEA